MAEDRIDICHRRKPDRCEAPATKQIYDKSGRWTYLCDQHAKEVDPETIDKVHDLHTNADWLNELLLFPQL
jgi:hypothetical protein